MSLHSEIYEQPSRLTDLLASQRKKVEGIAREIQARDTRFVFLAARGTSDNAGRYANYLWGGMNGLPMALATPSLFTYYQQPPRLRNALVVGISQSGQSPDIVSVVREGKRQGNLALAITNAPDSPLGQCADFVLNIMAGPELAVAATKTYTTELMAIAMLSAALTGTGQPWDELGKVAGWMDETLKLDERIQNAVQQYKDIKHCVVLGRGYNYATAFEWSLKIKELTYAVAEPYSSADFLHGPIAMVERGFPVVARPDPLLLDEERGELVLRKAVNFGAAEERTRLPVSEGLCGAAVRSREPVLVGDVQKDPRYVSLVKETRSELVVPLIVKDRVIGVFDLESPVLDRFTEQHLKVLTPLASQVAVAVENARLYAEIRKRDERLGRELRIAQEIQHALFPETTPSGSGWEASAHFRPARELGGDLYDFYDMGGGLLGVATGDVAGKGVPAALYAAFASGTIRARAFERRTPADLMQRVNRSLRRRGIEGLFCTLGYALFDFQDGTLRVANSGLPHPLHYRAADRRATPGARRSVGGRCPGSCARLR